jgi:dienelactone hydrolase
MSPDDTRPVEYPRGKKKFIGRLAVDEKAGGRRPGVVIFPEAFGLNEHARQRALRLAQLGYVALAADLNGGGVVNDDMAKVRPAIQA